MYWIDGTKAAVEVIREDGAFRTELLKAMPHLTSITLAPLLGSVSRVNEGCSIFFFFTLECYTFLLLPCSLLSVASMSTAPLDSWTRSFLANTRRGIVFQSKLVVHTLTTSFNVDITRPYSGLGTRERTVYFLCKCN